LFLNGEKTKLVDVKHFETVSFLRREYKMERNVWGGQKSIFMYRNNPPYHLGSVTELLFADEISKIFLNFYVFSFVFENITSYYNNDQLVTSCVYKVLTRFFTLAPSAPPPRNILCTLFNTTLSYYLYTVSN